MGVRKSTWCGFHNNQSNSIWIILRDKGLDNIQNIVFPKIFVVYIILICRKIGYILNMLSKRCIKRISELVVLKLC